MISVTTVVENVFCEKFTYYAKVLGLLQYEEKRGTVISGKTFHKTHEKTNQTFIPKHIQGKKITSAKFYSKKHDFLGIIDEAIELDDQVILIERKFSNYLKIHDTIKVQLGLLAILIEENMKKPVKKAYVIFHKDKRDEIVVMIDEPTKEYALRMLQRTKKIINSGIMPKSYFDNRCLNCCYRKICPEGSLNGNL